LRLAKALNDSFQRADSFRHGPFSLVSADGGFAELSLPPGPDQSPRAGLEEDVSEMACDRAEGRTFKLSQGLFGAPAGQADRDRAARAAERRALEASRTR
jgi:hypothetical protein